MIPAVNKSGHVQIGALPGLRKTGISKPVWFHPKLRMTKYLPGTGRGLWPPEKPLLDLCLKL